MGHDGSEISVPPHPAVMLPRRHHQATRRRRGPERGQTLRHVRAPPVPRRYPYPPSMAPRGGEQESKRRLVFVMILDTPGHGTPMYLPDHIFRSIAADLGNDGMILLLFETPSGFAVFSFCGVYLCEPNAMENLWINFVVDHRARNIALLREFQTFDDKFSAINSCTGVNERLKKMVLRYRESGQKLAVGKHDYKIIIENTIGVPCLFGEHVMEAMWGLQNLMHSLVPGEKSQLPNDDRLPMSHGLKKFLSDNGFDDVQPEMVSEQIIMTACALFECDYTEKKYGLTLFVLALRIKDVSDIDTHDWNSLKLATALKVIFFPEEVGDHLELFSEDETKLVEDAHKYASEMGMIPALRAYKEMVSAYEVRSEKEKLLGNMITEAKERMKLKIAEDS